MRQLATLAVVVVSVSLWPTTATGDSFGDWASDHGYTLGAVMPEEVRAENSAIDSLNGIGDFDWNTTPTTWPWLNYNQLSSIESGDFDGLANLQTLSWWHRSTTWVPYERGA